MFTIATEVLSTDHLHPVSSRRLELLLRMRQSHRWAIVLTLVYYDDLQVLLRQSIVIPLYPGGPILVARAPTVSSSRRRPQVDPEANEEPSGRLWAPYISSTRFVNFWSDSRAFNLNNTSAIPVPPLFSLRSYPLSSHTMTSPHDRDRHHHSIGKSSAKLRAPVCLSFPTPFRRLMSAQGLAKTAQGSETAT